MINELKKVIRVIYWYQYTNFLKNTDNGSHLVAATFFASMGGVFVFGLLNYITAFGVLVIVKYTNFFLAVGVLLGLFVWGNVCLKDEGYQEEKDYFNAIPEGERRKVGWWLNLYFIGACFFPYLSSILLIAIVKFAKTMTF